MKSDMVVPAVLVDKITVQYRNGRYDFANSCALTVTRKKPIRMMVLTAYPTSMVMDSKSPAVSPKVVAQIFMIQNANVISGSLLRGVGIVRSIMVVLMCPGAQVGVGAIQ